MSTRIITIFGGSGFIGHHLVGRLAAAGHQIRLAVRDTEKAATLMTQGNVGQVVGVQANIRNQASVERAVAGADIVINLVGLLYEAGAQKFNAVHEDGAACVARAAKAAGVSQLVHMSALGADTASKSKYAHTKAVGENAVMKAFEGATIIRPSVVFGAGDKFTNKFAALGSISPAIPLLDGGKNQMQPVSVEDLADAMAKIVLNPEYQGKIWEFGGPDALPLSEIIGIIEKVSKRSSIIL
ncbi:MAG: complex I NDUFA9 subunit family protein, partial [Sneathiella sp.]|nr:complex I NDUFA9 subunit family protein [Sneathiella sp.]